VLSSKCGVKTIVFGRCPDQEPAVHGQSEKVNQPAAIFLLYGRSDPLQHIRASLLVPL
jgi:hypothetical protein